MISIIKTAIITIIISFISGLLLEHYKNLAPRILCNIGNGIPLELNNKKICAYILTVRNISNKTIHKLTLNIQGSQNNLKIGDAKITKGLKFDSSIEGNSLDVYIPFLSKDDEFSVTLYVENQYGEYNKPVVTIRSPEDFKEVDSVEEKGILFLLFNIPKNINKVASKTMKNNETMVSNKKGNFTTVMSKVPGTKKTKNKENREILHRSKKLSKNKKAMIAIASIILVISIGILGKLYFQEIYNNTQTPSAETDIQKQSTDATESAGGTTKNPGAKASTGGTTKNSGTKTSTDRTTKNTDTRTSTDVTNENTNAKASTSGTTGNTDTKTATDETTGNTDTRTSAGETTGNTKTSTDVTTKNTDTKTSTSGTTGNTDAKTSTGETAGNTDTKTSSSGTTGSSDTKISSSGTTGSTGN
ncbi:MAG: hypothetical protein LLF98_03440 [Clostridium sp.]|uniref:hypothetical protein n=1 Tax=Clostridium sp. TaxID=1506 RepID=UPI0025C58413|nr:hypothetical protein [Clostridium sp.]MCE5220327.1 hypothetical protein [Clostridium sp.]